jgi:hypothetical protein
MEMSTKYKIGKIDAVSLKALEGYLKGGAQCDREKNSSFF